MFQEFLSGSNLLVWPIVGFVIFFVAFMAVLGYVAFGNRRNHTLDRLASLPLDDDALTVDEAGPDARDAARKTGGE